MQGNSFEVPILFLIFNRPDTSLKVLEKIRAIKPQQLFIAADGPGNDKEEERIKCAERRRAVLENIDWECEVKTLFRDQNLGCGKGVSSAINWFFHEVEQGIILEDDCVPHSSFFDYCRLMLERYKNNEKIRHIAGVNFQNGIQRGDGSCYFSKYPHVWGWATWRRAWQHYDFQLGSWPAFKKTSQFKQWCTFKNEERFWTNIFDAMYKGEIDTWDYQWQYACLKGNSFCVMPNVNLISNIGFREDATHTFYEVEKDNPQRGDLPTQEYVLPDKISTLIVDVNADEVTYTKIFNRDWNNDNVYPSVTKKAIRYFKKMAKTFLHKVSLRPQPYQAK